MPQFLTTISEHKPSKYAVSKSLCSSFCHNPCNLQRPWYGPWCQVLTDLTEQFDNMIVIPQFPLWFIPEDDDSDSDEEESGDNDPDDIDELDLIGQKDEDEQDSERGDVGDDMDAGNVTTDSVGTISGSDVAELFPDFVILHVLGKSLPANHPQFTQLGGVVITHECCTVIVENKNKKAPSRQLGGRVLIRAVDVLLGEAQEQLGIQCYHLFARYLHALQTIAIAAAGDYWRFRIVHRHEIPKAIGDSISTTAWDQLHWPLYARLSSPISDGRLQEIYNILRKKPVLDLR